MKKTIIALMALAGVAVANTSILTFDQVDYSFDTDKWALNSMGNGAGSAREGAFTLKDKTVATMSITGGKFWASATGDGFNNTAVSAPVNNLTMIKVTGKLAEDEVQFAANAAKNGWAMVSYTIPEPATTTLSRLALAGTQPAPTPAPAPVVSPWAVELGAGYNNAAKSPFHIGKDWFGPQKKVNTWSWDLTGVYNLDENNALTLRLGYAHGNRQQEESIRIITNTWSLMPGYRYTYALNDKWSAFAGANVGLVSFAWLDKEPLGNIHKSGWGFGYSAELGVRYAFCGNWDAFVAYHFCGDTASPRAIVTRNGQSTSIRPKKQNFHGVRIGVGYKF